MIISVIEETYAHLAMHLRRWIGLWIRSSESIVVLGPVITKKIVKLTSLHWPSMFMKEKDAEVLHIACNLPPTESILLRARCGTVFLSYVLGRSVHKPIIFET